MIDLDLAFGALMLSVIWAGYVLRRPLKRFIRGAYRRGRHH